MLIASISFAAVKIPDWFKGTAATPALFSFILGIIFQNEA